MVESLKLTFKDPEFQAWAKGNPPLPRRQLEPKAYKAEVIRNTYGLRNRYFHCPDHNQQD